MVSKKWGVVICATITLVVSLALDESIIKPIIQSLNDAFPCQENSSWFQTCQNTKFALFFVPYVGTFAAVFGFLSKTGLLDD